MRTRWLWMFLLFGNAVAVAANSVLVTAVDGTVRLEGAGAGKGGLEAFMRLNTGDRLTLPAGSKAVLVYVAAGRLESWRGSGALLIGDNESKAVGGKPELSVRKLPAEVAQQMNRTPAPQGNRYGMARLAEVDSGASMSRAEQMPSARAARSAPLEAAAPPPERPVGMVRLRGMAPPDAVESLERKYRELRAEILGKDLTAEIFLLAGLFELHAYQRLETELQRIAADFPKDNAATALRETYLRALAQRRETEKD